jgi:Ca2+-binding EF-hand superfamily protein
MNEERKAEQTDEAKQLAYLRELFNHFDKNGDGTVSRDELISVMASLGKALSEEQVQAIITRVDVNSNGSIEFQEFLDMLNYMMENGF